ncbi:unnamed protein product [Meloidogyne enterolobii]|uniref:Uncharacterized protein n=1 Tax=Meloidogyne enterolobii TaxID=390850 RepID=A0ACB1B586_MELEN
MSSIPEKFLGKFKHEKSENFEEYLAARGVSWIFRKLISFTSITKVFEKSTSATGKYDAHNISSKGDTPYIGWALDEEFEAKGLDGKQHKITFQMDGEDTLTEKHIRLDKEGKAEPEDVGEVYRYSIDDNDKLVLTLEKDSITARRFFTRVQ